MSTDNRKNKISAKQRGLRGAVIGFIIMAVFLFFFDQWVTANGDYVDRTRYLGMLAVAPLYGFGYAFGYKKMAGWFANALHYSGNIMGFAFIWWVLTGSKKGFLRGLFLIMVMFGMVASAAWVPGIPMGIREIREESKLANLVINTSHSENAASSLKKPAILKRTVSESQAAASPVSAPAVEAPQQTAAQAAEASVSTPTVRSPRRTPTPAIEMPLPGSRLLCYGGEYAGGSFDLSNGKELVIGRDPGCSNIIVPGADISRAHCKVRYNTAEKCAEVMDLSSNGTSLLDGTPIPKNQYVTVKSGNGIRIGAKGPVFLFS